VEQSVSEGEAIQLLGSAAVVKLAERPFAALPELSSSYVSKLLGKAARPQILLLITLPALKAFSKCSPRAATDAHNLPAIAICVHML
jgi:hypothetical protein